MRPLTVVTLRLPLTPARPVRTVDRDAEELRLLGGPPTVVRPPDDVREVVDRLGALDRLVVVVDRRESEGPRVVERDVVERDGDDAERVVVERDGAERVVVERDGAERVVVERDGDERVVVERDGDDRDVDGEARRDVGVRLGAALRVTVRRLDVTLRDGLRLDEGLRVVALRLRLGLRVVARRFVVRGLLTRAFGRLAEERRTLCEDRFGAASAVSTTTPPNNSAHRRVNGMRGLRSP